MARESMLEMLNVYNCAVLTAHEDMFNGDPATDVLSMENYAEIIFIIVKSAGATGTATITIESCDNVTPSNTQAVAFTYKIITSGNTQGATTAAAAAGFATTAGANQAYAISIKRDQLDGDDKYVRMVMTEAVDSPVDGGVASLGAYPRYAQDALVEMIT